MGSWVFWGQREHPDPCPDATHDEVPGNSYLGLSGGPSRCETGSPRPRLCAQESQRSRDESGGTVLAPRVQRAVTLGRTPSAGPGGQPLIPFCQEGTPPTRLVASCPSPPSHGPGRMKEVWELCAHRGDDRVENTLSCGALCQDRNIAACFKEGGLFQEWLSQVLSQYSLDPPDRTFTLAGKKSAATL